MPPMSEATASVTQRLPVSLVKRLDTEAKQRAETMGMNVSRTAVIRSILTEHFREKEGACTAPKKKTPK